MRFVKISLALLWLALLELSNGCHNPLFAHRRPSGYVPRPGDKIRNILKIHNLPSPVIECVVKKTKTLTYKTESRSRFSSWSSLRRHFGANSLEKHCQKNPTLCRNVYLCLISTLGQTSLTPTNLMNCRRRGNSSDKKIARTLKCLQRHRTASQRSG